MKITCAFVKEKSDPGGPWLIASYDDVTEDSWNGIPDFYKEELAKYSNDIVRECTFVISDDFVDGLFAIPETAARNPQPKDPA